MKGDGRIFKLKKRGSDGQLHELPYWHIGYYGPSKKGDGKWVEMRETSGSPDERVARMLLRKRLVEIANHRAGRVKFIGPRGDRLLVRETNAMVIRDYETRRLASLKQTRNSITVHLDPILGDDRVVAVTRDRQNQYVKIRRSEGAADATIDRELEKLGRGFAMAFESGLIAQKPGMVRHLVKMHSNARQGFIEKRDFVAISEALEEQDVRDLLTWMFLTGMRSKESRTLTWQCFDSQEWAVRLSARESKSGYGRVVSLSAGTREVIESRIARRRLDCDLIFHLEGRKIPNLQRRWKNACRAAGVPDRIMHDLRRSAVRNLIRAGVSERTAMDISGHRTRSMFDRYNITDQADIRQAGERLSAYFAALEERKNGTVSQMPTRKPEGSDTETEG